jgi:DNA-binding NarL/FixJ family response regulator
MSLQIPVRVFLLSDHRLLREALTRVLTDQPNIVLVGAQGSADATEEIIESACDVLLVDPANAGAFDYQVLDNLRRAISGLELIMIDMEAGINSVKSVILNIVQGKGHFVPEADHSDRTSPTVFSAEKSQKEA